MADNLVVLKGDAVNEVSLLQRNIGYSDSSKMAGKTYSRFRYNGIVFIVGDDLGFGDALAEGKVYSAKLLKGKRKAIVSDDEGKETEVEVDSLTFDSFITTKQKLNVALFETKLTMLPEIAKMQLSQELVDELASVTV